MPFELPPIVKLAHRIRVELEQAVRGFSRYHKYSVGEDLRAQARDVVRVTNRAWRDRKRQIEYTTQLAFAIDELKLTAQLAKEVKAFASFPQFEMIAKLLNELGQQCGGWKKDQQRKSQNAAANKSPTQRAQILSARDTPSGVNV